MRYLDLVAQRPLMWALLLIYFVVTGYLAWLGHKKTSDIKTFAIGTGKMSPWVVGVTLAASIASTATFVINPGFVYVHGVSALMHLGVAAGLGVIVGLVLMSSGFRRLGAQSGALTLPGWLGERYGSRGLRVAFAAVNLLSLSFVVLIVGGLSIVVQHTLGLTNTESLILIIGFVFSYIFVGGTWAHAYTNTLQGVVMVVVAVIIVASGLPLLLGGGVADKLAAIDPNLVRTVNPTSPLFGSFFSVWISGFVIGFGLVCQPHIMSKALYVEDDAAVRKYLAITVAVSFAFTALLLVGLYAHLADLPRAAFVDPVSGAFRQDRVMTVYLAQSFGPVTLSVITVALLAAGMSTLDGILVALSSIAGHDLFLGLFGKTALAGVGEEARARRAHRVSQGLLVALGVATFVIALKPPVLLGIFGQLGVYGIVAASTVPIAFGIFFPRMGKVAAASSAVAGLALHFGLYGWGAWASASGVDLQALVTTWPTLSWVFDRGAPQLGLSNPGVTATYGILGSAAVATAAVVAGRVRRPLGADAIAA